MAKTNCVATRRSEQVRASRPVLSLIAFLALFIAIPTSAQPSARSMSVKDYLALSADQQSTYSGDFIAKFTAEVGQTNPKLMQQIRDWFVKVPPGKHFPEGMTNFNLELWVLQDLSKEGKIDLSKIPVNGVIIKVIKDKFAPPKRAATPDRK